MLPRCKGFCDSAPWTCPMNLPHELLLGPGDLEVSLGTTVWKYCQTWTPAVWKGELLFSSVGPVKLIHGHWLCSSSKIQHILAQYRFEYLFGFVYAGFSKKYLEVLFNNPVIFSPKHPLLEAFLLIKAPKTWKKRFLPKKMENLVKNTFVIWVWKSLKDWAAQNNYLKKNK